MAYCDEVTPDQTNISSNSAQQDTDEAMDSEELFIAESPFSQADVEELYGIMREYLQVEDKFQPRLVLSVNPQVIIITL